MVVIRLCFHGECLQKYVQAYVSNYLMKSTFG